MSRVLAASIALALLSACRTEPLRVNPGELVLVSANADGTQTQTRELTVDFGTLVIGQTISRRVVVKNRGSGSLVVSRISPVSGSSVAAFQVPFEGEVVLGPAEELELKLSFTPLASAEMAVEYLSVLSVEAENALEDSGQAVLTLKGRGIQSWCDIQDAVDFGPVERGTAHTLAFEISNPTEIDATAWIADFEGRDAAAFSFEDSSVRGSFVLPARTTRTVFVRFTPTEIRPYLAHVRVQGEGSCWQNAVLFTGDGVDRTLLWEPDLLDFGSLLPGTRATRKVTLTNIANDDVLLSDIRTTGETAFTASTSTLTVPGRGGTAEIEVTFSPDSPGFRQGRLEFGTSLASRSRGMISLIGFTGGPAVRVEPATLGFGRVAWFANAPEASRQVRRITVTNVGNKRDSQDPLQNLHLGLPAQIVPANAETGADEFTVSLAPGSWYDPTVGLPPQAGQNTLQLEVTLSPKSVHRKEAVLTFTTNDPRMPEVSVNVTAEVVVMPPCRYEVIPAQLQFGVLGPSEEQVQSFVIRNLGQQAEEVCIVSGLDLLPGADPAFTLEAGPVSEAELQAGASLEVRVRARSRLEPTANVLPANGLVGFHMSSDQSPDAVVPIQADLVQPCIVVAPDRLNFGSIEAGCASSSRTVTLYNGCPAPVTLTGVSPSPAGSEFELASNVGLGPSGRLLYPGQTHSFDVRYRPVDVGGDTGRMELAFESDGHALRQSIELTGTGVAQGRQTQTFVQEATPKADILFVLDGSGSMAMHQANLATNAAAIFSNLTADGIDYRIAVIKGEGEPTNASVGHFLWGQNDPDRIITPGTNNAEAQFLAKLSFGAWYGSNEQCFEPALRALTSPLADSENSGFLRTDVPLAIVCITDDRDQSPDTTAHYLSGFRALKASRPELLTVSAIGVFQSACGHFDDGRYSSMVDATGGARADICRSDWATVLRDVGGSVFAAQRSFTLQSPLDSTRGAPEVQVDGVNTPATNANGERVWTWYPAKNAVTFERAHRPGPGAVVTISYYGQCF